MTFAIAISNAIDEYNAGKKRGDLRRSIQELEFKFNETWLHKLFHPRTSSTLAVKEIDNKTKEDIPCNKERFILFVLSELGILSKEKDLIPLAKASDNIIKTFELTVSTDLTYNNNLETNLYLFH
jgi:hypothetical protein